MPLVFIKNIDNDTRLGLWKIADELHTDEVCPQMVCNELKQKCARRQTETVAVYALLHAITGRTDLVIGHNADGKPTIDGYNIIIQLADPSRAGIIVPAEQPENEDILMLIMPMLLND
jgi:hypothetical protein